MNFRDYLMVYDVERFISDGRERLGHLGCSEDYILEWELEQRGRYVAWIDAGKPEPLFRGHKV